MADDKRDETTELAQTMHGAWVVACDLVGATAWEDILPESQAFWIRAAGVMMQADVRIAPGYQEVCDALEEVKYNVKDDEPDMWGRVEDALAKAGRLVV